MKKLQISKIAQAMIQEDTLVIDAEMASSKEPSIISLCVMSSKTGEVLLDTLVATKFEISEEAFRVHKIKQEDLENAPSFSDVWKQLESLRSGRKISSFMNTADFEAIEFTLAHEPENLLTDLKDVDIYPNPLAQYGIDDVHPVSADLKEDVKAHCIQDLYLKMYGTGNGKGLVSLKNAIKRIKAEFKGEAHQARTDTQAAVDILHHIAGFESRVKSKK